MYDDPLTALERELVAAARRRAGLARTKHPWGAARLGAALAVAACVLAAVIAVGAILLLGSRSGNGVPATQLPPRTITVSPSTTTTGSFNSSLLQLEPHFHALIGTFGVGPSQQRELVSVVRQLGLSGYQSFGSTGGFIKAPGDVKIGLIEIVVQGGGRAKIDKLAAVLNGSVIDSAPAPVALRRGLTLIYDNSSPIVRIAEIVPNQVRAVSVSSPRVVPARAAVHNNVAFFRITGSGAISTKIASRATWFGSGGRMLAQITR